MGVCVKLAGAMQPIADPLAQGLGPMAPGERPRPRNPNEPPQPPGETIPQSEWTEWGG